ncbi:hypothetical protein PR048_029645 [Dryococelus australis]|uniref:Uncharacterized protein n=1 Tax=Dryococelus australis TaxID=614101 RepID=A0ABQ9GDY7_9NEOP|nr:hypothetical protein PR048_029645 [Dryococelus australis]
MEELLIPSAMEPYSTKHIKRVIEDRYGKEDIITFRETAKSILYSYCKLPGNVNAEEERLTIEVSLEFIPLSRRLMLSSILPKQHSTPNVAAFGQAIIQAARTRALMSPMEIGLTVEMLHHLGSRFLIGTLKILGFCSSYYEVLKIEKSAAVTQEQLMEGVSQYGVIQYIADNVDQHIYTIDDHGTFQGMGIIAAVTPVSDRNNLQFLDWNLEKALDCHTKLLAEDSCKNLDHLGYTSWFFHQVRPGWQKFMQTIHKGQHFGR